MTPGSTSAARSIKFGLVDRDGRLVHKGQVRSPEAMAEILAVLEETWTGAQEEGPRPRPLLRLRHRRVLQPQGTEDPPVAQLPEPRRLPAPPGPAQVHRRPRPHRQRRQHGRLRRIQARGGARRPQPRPPDRRNGHRLGHHPRRQAVGGRGRLRRRDRPHHRQSGRRALRLRRRGCLETEASAPRMVRNFQALTGRTDITDSREVYLLAKAGDPAALESFRKLAYWLGIGIGIVINLSIPRRSSSAAGSSRPGSSCSSRSPRKPAGGRTPSPSPAAVSRKRPWATTPASSARPPGPVSRRDTGDEEPSPRHFRL